MRFTLYMPEYSPVTIDSLDQARVRSTQKPRQGHTRLSLYHFLNTVVKNTLLNPHHLLHILPSHLPSLLCQSGK